MSPYFFFHLVNFVKKREHTPKVEEEKQEQAVDLDEERESRRSVRILQAKTKSEGVEEPIMAEG